MFKYEITSKYKPGVLLGHYNIEIPFFVSIKNCLEEKYKNNINYIEITSEKLKAQQFKRRKEKDFDELGMISLKWLEKIQELIPGVIAQMLDITDLVVNSPNLDINKIAETIIKEILKIKTVYQSSNQIIIIKNLKRLYGIEESLKNIVLTRFKYLNSKCFLLINDPNYLTNLDLIKKIASLIKDEINNHYIFKIKYYRNKYKNHENNEQKEYAIKNLIKTFLLSKLSNIINIDTSINYYDYIQKAYNILTKKLNKKSYMFCQPNIKVIYLEMKNIADFLILQLLSQNNIPFYTVIKLIINHLNIFDFINFNDDKKTNIITIINACKNMKDIYFINMAWKHCWYNFLLQNYKKVDLVDICNISLKGYIMNNLIHLYSFLTNEPNFIQEINSTINLESNYKKMKNNKYIEKIPKFYEVNEDNIIGKLSDEENLALYICQIIFENKNLVKPQNIMKIIENLILNSKTNYYDYFLINKFFLINKENEKESEVNKILEKILHKNNRYLRQFPKIYLHLSTELNKYVLESKFDNTEENDYNIFKQIEYLIKYHSINKNDLTNEEVNKINELLSYNIYENKKIIINSFENELFNIEVNYNANKVKPLDFIKTNIIISLLKKEILFSIDKIVVYFPKSDNKKEKFYKIITLDKELSINNPIEISFNNLVKFFFYHLYIIHIELHLKNKLIIYLTNKEKRNIVFNNKDNDSIKENDIIDLDFNKYNSRNEEKKDNGNINREKSKVILVGKNENHLFYLHYSAKIKNDDVYIKHTKVIIKLISGYSKNGEELNNFSFKTINSEGLNHLGNKELVLESENINCEKNPQPFEFILQLGDTGNYGINYEIYFTLINKNCPNDYYNLKLNKNLILQCIEPFKFTNEINSSLYYINQQNKIKAYPINHPIKLTSIYENKLKKKCIIKKIENLPSSDFIQINSTIEKIFSKKHNYKIEVLPKEKISFQCKIISKENSNVPIGKIKILWISEDLYNHQYYNDSFLNESIFDLNHLVITKLPIIIQGQYINKNNKYQLKIKNLESMSKIIKFSMKEINTNSKEEKFILSGKTNINEVLLPLKELNIQYNIYDAITGSNFFDVNESLTYKFNNLITLNEYYIVDNKDKFDLKALRNIIYYLPELFQL